MIDLTQPCHAELVHLAQTATAQKLRYQVDAVLVVVVKQTWQNAQKQHSANQHHTRAL